jgi:asparagine synthase (glutamine-hydrolysing)
MQMIYGSIIITHPPEPVETENQNVVRMMAALGAYPWEAKALRNWTGVSGYGAIATHASTENSAPHRLPDAGGLIIAADARLDNRPELCVELGINAAEQASLDDAELILRAYRQWDTNCVPHLLGDFAFALWDETVGRLFCARDYVGVRPFYYHYAPGSGRFAFASDLLALAAHPDVPLQLNLASIAAALEMAGGQLFHLEHTFYRGIEKLPPAHCLTLDADGLRCWAYWQPGQTSERRYPDEQEYNEEMLQLLQVSVACRVASPHPVGAHISGGLDSSSVAVLAHRILKSQGRSVTGFSWAPPLPENLADLYPGDERKLVEEARQAEDFPVRYTRLTPAHVLAYTRRDVTLQPTASLQFELAASTDAASLGIRTMLSGWGGDELLAFNGRGYFSDLLRRGHWLTLQRELSQRHQLHGGSAVWKQWILSGIFPFLPITLLRLLQPEQYPPSQSLPACLRPDFAASLVCVEPLTIPKAREHPGVRRMQIALLKHGHLSYRMESWASHGATLGLAYAFPLLDRRLVEFALSIPDYFFFKNGWKRYLYRTAMAGILPDNLRWQKIKEDPAMYKSLNIVRKEVAEQLRAELLARVDNPYVDVKQIAAALESQEIRNAAVDDDTLLAQTPRMRQQMNVGRGMWLAYVNKKAEIPA